MKGSTALKPKPSKPQQPADTDEWVDDRQLAARTPISRMFWQHLRSSGKGPAYYKVGRRCLYKFAEVLAWLESKRTEPKAS